MTNYYRRPQMQWSGATGGIVRCKRVSTEYARKSGSGRVLRSTCGEKPKPKDGTRPSKPCMRRAQDKNNPASLLQSRIGLEECIIELGQLFAQGSALCFANLKVTEYTAPVLRSGGKLVV